MSEQNDEGQNFALIVLALVLGLVIAGVLTLAVSTTRGHGTPRAAQTSAAPGLEAAGPDGRIYFELGSAALPPDASAVLVRVADAARAQAGKIVQISGYHDASGDAARNAELAKERALAVRHALEANGVAADHLVMDKPIATTGGANAREARRVDLRLR
jgi:outer membrane protein OmpA-like peptidoglycan-associated protein